MVSIIEYITNIVNMFFMNYGALGVFIGTVIEEIIAPIPSTVVILASSFFMLHSLPISIESIGSLVLYIELLLYWLVVSLCCILYQ